MNNSLQGFGSFDCFAREPTTWSLATLRTREPLRCRIPLTSPGITRGVKPTYTPHFLSEDCSLPPSVALLPAYNAELDVLRTVRRPPLLSPRE